MIVYVALTTDSDRFNEGHLCLDQNDDPIIAETQNGLYRKMVQSCYHQSEWTTQIFDAASLVRLAFQAKELRAYLMSVKYATDNGVNRNDVLSRIGY